MRNNIKVWKKSIERCKTINYTQVPPIIKEWVRAEREIQDDNGDLIEKIYDLDGMLIEIQITKENSCHVIRLDKQGNIIERFMNIIKHNDEGDEINCFIDNKWNTIEEKLEYDKNGRTIRKCFIENEELNDYIEFGYDDLGKAITTIIYKNDAIEYYEKEISNSDDNIYLLKYDANKNLNTINESIVFESFVHKNFSYFPNGDLINKNELEYYDNGDMKEQRFYNGKEELVQRIIFGPVNTKGSRLFEKNIEYIGTKPSIEKITTYEYHY